MKFQQSLNVRLIRLSHQFLGIFLLHEIILEIDIKRRVFENKNIVFGVNHTKLFGSTKLNLALSLAFWLKFK